MATEAMAIADRSLSIGRVFSRAFSVIGNNPLVVLGIAFLLGALPRLGLVYATTAVQLDMVQRMVMVGIIGLATASVAVTMVFQALVQGVIVHATLADHNGERTTLGESVGFALGRIVPLLGVSILFALASIAGLLLLVVPFFFVVTRWAVAPSAAVAERIGIGGAFRRSSALTAGARLKILGLGFLVLIVSWVISAICSVTSVAFVAPVPGIALNPIAMVVTTIGATLTSAFWATMQASLYVELVDWKDGPAAQSMAEIFA